MNSEQSIIQYFGNNISSIENIEKKIHKKPTVKQVHKLRVASRRIMTLKQIFGLGKIPELSKLVKKLGKLRDLDVGIENAIKYHFDESSLIRKRKIARDKLISFTSKKKRKRVEKEIHDAEIKLQEKLSPGVVPIIEEFRQKLMEEFDEELSADDLHHFRITIKKARYFFESLGKPVDDLIKLQDHLGQIHDLDVLSEFYRPSKDLERDKQKLLKQLPAIQSNCMKQLDKDFEYERNLQ